MPCRSPRNTALGVGFSYSRRFLRQLAPAPSASHLLLSINKLHHLRNFIHNMAHILLLKRRCTGGVMIEYTTLKSDHN
jgi:hypothetical protein